jgi:putative dimethyl sulfoxide reductase chaperone
LFYETQSGGNPLAPGNDLTLTATALRDFFVARDAAEMEKAYRSLATAAPEVEEWKAVEFAFNRLFVGPGPVAAPPYASIYIDNEPFVMGETTLKIRRLYEMIGLRSPWSGTVPDDHISLELDACIHMHQGLRQSSSDQLKVLYDYFLSEHVSQWIPKFIDTVTQADEVPDPILRVCRELSAWLARESARHSELPEAGNNP